MPTIPRLLPRLGPDNRFFWTSGADGKLRFLCCGDCATFVHPPQPLCPRCHSEDVAPVAVAGTGTVETFTINHQKWHPAMEVPFVIARIAIDGAPGVILTSNVIGCPVDEVAIGTRVRVVFEQQDDVWLPLFEKLD
jgi:uncharacterized OB-fold protein